MSSEKEPFESKLKRWTVSELEHELTKTDIYGERKLRMLKQEHARRRIAQHGEAPDEDRVEDKPPVHWGRMGVIVSVVGVIVATLLALYAS